MTNEELIKTVQDLKASNEKLTKTVQELKDRSDIFDALTAYSRGRDRLDEDMCMSAYWPDGYDDHGPYVGPVTSYVPWGQEIHRVLHDATNHSLSNFRCEINGNEAHCETYWAFTALNKEKYVGPGTPRVIRHTGRYIDRMEKRNGIWKIADRVCVIDCGDPNVDMAGDESISGAWIEPGRGDNSDVSYMRPLKIDRSREAMPPAPTDD